MKFLENLVEIDLYLKFILSTAPSETPKVLKQQGSNLEALNVRKDVV